MDFEVFNAKNKRIFYCFEKTCLPTMRQIAIMAKVGCKFKINGKPIAKKKLEEFIKGD